MLDGLARIAPLTVVNGNAPDDPRYPERVLRHLERLRVGMVHRSPRPGDEWVRGLDVCIHGHSHRWRDEVVDGTCGMLSIDGDRADLERIEF